MAEEMGELHGLWTAVFGEPPPIAASPGLLCEILVRCLPPAPPYPGPGEGDPFENEPLVAIGSLIRATKP